MEDEALIGSILRHMVDLVFPSKPWAPNVHLVRVGLVTSERERTRKRRRVAEWLVVDLGMGEEVLVSGCLKSDLGHC